MSTTRPWNSPGLVKHFVLVWALSPALFALVGWAIAKALGADRAEVNTWVLIGLLAGFFGGWILALITWAIRWGLSGWVYFGRRIMGKHSTDTHADTAFDADGVYRGSEEHEPAPLPPLRLPADDPWQGKNPYGCCRHNVNANGYPTHGAPGCKHPEAR